MSTAFLNYQAANTNFAHNGPATVASTPAGGSCGFNNTAAELHDLPPFVQTNETGVDCEGQQCADNGGGDVPFGDLFFQSLLPEGGTDAVQPMEFEGFCFDNICGDGVWPTCGVAMDEPPQDSTADGNHHNTEQSFHFLLADDAMPSTSAGAAVVGGGGVATTGDAAMGETFGLDSTVAQPTSVVADAAAAPTSTAVGPQQPSTTHETSAAITDVTAHSFTADPIAVTPGPQVCASSNGGRSSVAHETGGVTGEAGRNVASVSLDQSRPSLRLNDTTVSSIGSTAASGAAASRVPREGVEELLRRAEQILREGDVCGAALNVGAEPASGAHESSKNQSDTVFSAQVSHWLRRGAEVEESALATIADLQLRLTQTMRLFGAHTGLSSALGSQYATTPVVLTLPLALPLLSSLLEEE